MISSESAQDNSTERILDKLCKHIVCLSWLDALISPDVTKDAPPSYQPAAFAISSFVIAVQGLWCLVTAGHILSDLERRLKNGRRIVKSRLIDAMAGASGTGSIPFDLENAPRWHIDDNAGLDYGVILLRPLFVHQLLAGGIQALTAESWIDIPSDPDACFLLGFPKAAKRSDVRQFEGGGDIQIEVGTPLLPVEWIDNPPESLRKTADRYYAKVPIITADESGLGEDFIDIDGMSGGPLFLVKNKSEGGLRYWIAGVQSSWLPDLRVLAACPIQPLADGISRCIDRHGYLEDGHMPSPKK